MKYCEDMTPRRDRVGTQRGFKERKKELKLTFVKRQDAHTSRFVGNTDSSNVKRSIAPRRAANKRRVISP
jgi:hypothetical protein